MGQLLEISSYRDDDCYISEVLERSVNTFFYGWILLHRMFSGGLVVGLPDDIEETAAPDFSSHHSF
jgi:hypothetical protein